MDVTTARGDLIEDFRRTHEVMERGTRPLLEPVWRAVASFTDRGADAWGSIDYRADATGWMVVKVNGTRYRVTIERLDRV